jgi:hypothetical protein
MFTKGEASKIRIIMGMILWKLNMLLWGKWPHGPVASILYVLNKGRY